MPGGGDRVKIRPVVKAPVSWGTRYREDKSDMKKVAQFRLVQPWRQFPKTRKSKELWLLYGSFRREKCVPFWK